MAKLRLKVKNVPKNTCSLFVLSLLPPISNPLPEITPMAGPEAVSGVPKVPRTCLRGGAELQISKAPFSSHQG